MGRAGEKEEEQRILGVEGKGSQQPSAIANSQISTHYPHRSSVLSHLSIKSVIISGPPFYEPASIICATHHEQASKKAILQTENSLSPSSEEGLSYSHSTQILTIRDAFFSSTLTTCQRHKAHIHMNLTTAIALGQI